MEALGQQCRVQLEGKKQPRKRKSPPKKKKGVGKKTATTREDRKKRISDDGPMPIRRGPWSRLPGMPRKQIPQFLEALLRANAAESQQQNDEAAGTQASSQEEAVKDDEPAAKRQRAPLSIDTSDETNESLTNAIGVNRSDDDVVEVPPPNARLVYDGPPDDALKSGSWPPGWTKRVYEHLLGERKGQRDTYYYPPLRPLRSLEQVEQFLATSSIDECALRAAFVSPMDQVLSMGTFQFVGGDYRTLDIGAPVPQDELPKVS